MSPGDCAAFGPSLLASLDRFFFFLPSRVSKMSLSGSPSRRESSRVLVPPWHFGASGVRMGEAEPTERDKRVSQGALVTVMTTGDFPQTFVFCFGGLAMPRTTRFGFQDRTSRSP